MVKTKRSRNTIPVILYLISCFGVFCVYDILSGPWYKYLLLVPALQGTYSTAAVATAMLNKDATLFQKRANGTFPMTTYLLFWPYLLVYVGMVFLHRTVRRYEPVTTQVMPGWYLSGWINSAKCLIDAGSTAKKVAILDLTCELPRFVFKCTKCDVKYLNIPVLDRLSPTVADIEAATNWCKDMRGQGYDVVVHCAFGHGRSATCLIAALMSCGVRTGIEDTEQWLRGMRPHVQLTSVQFQRLTEWENKNKSE